MILKRYWKLILMVQFVVALCVFTIAALLPSKSLVDLNQPDYVLHFLGNLALYLSAWLALFGRLSPLWLLCLLAPYSLVVELVQFFSPGRTVDMRDFCVNILGLCSGMGAALALKFVLDRYLRNKADKFLP